jgi:hypothetical protein
VLAVYGMIHSVYNWNTSTIEHISNRESALNHIWNKEKDGVFDKSRPNADARLATRKLLTSTRQTHVSPKWVRGHADKREFMVYKQQTLLRQITAETMLFLRV